MYQSFRANNFRCFQDLRLTDLKRVNLIAGKNNAGKTALLEGLFIHGGAYNPELTMRINAFRGITGITVELRRGVETPWDSLFNNLDISKTVELRGTYKGIGHRAIRLRVVQDPKELTRVAELVLKSSERAKVPPLSSEAVHVLRFDCREKGRTRSYYMIFDQQGWRIRPIPPTTPYQIVFLPARRSPPSLMEDAERFGKLDIKGEQKILLESLKVVDSRLERLTVVASGRGKDASAIIYGDIGIGRLLPLPVMGEGLVRLASLVLAIGDAKDGVVLVDEIENGLHYSVLYEVWQAIGKAARKFNTQIFATTHSRECIIAAHRAFADSKRYDFRLHRLEQAKGKTHAITYDQETLEAAIETKLEVR